MPVHDLPPSIDFQVTTLATITMSAFFGLTTGTGRSPPPMRPAGRLSVVARVQVSPASSDRKMPTACPVATVAYKRRGSLGAAAMSACVTPSGSPFVSGFHVLPPSVDLKMPPLVPFHAPFSHGPCRVSHRHAYRMSGSFGSNSRSEAPVFSSL